MNDKDTVFIVDDDDAVRDSLTLAFTRAGYAVETYDSAEAFLSGYRPGTEGCLVLDVRMQGMNGFSLQAQMPRRHIDVPIVFLTAHGDVPAAVRAMENGAATFLEKPVRNEVLINRVRSALERHQATLKSGALKREAADKLALLSRRERQVADLLVEGHSSKEIARLLDVSPRTVDAHRTNIRRKTGAASIGELARTVFESERD